jgi:hypothetical protein
LPFPIKLELADVFDYSPGPLEESKGATLTLVAQHCGVSAYHPLVSTLALAVVVVDAIGRPFVEVAVPLARLRVREEKDIRTLARGADAALATAAILFVQLRPLNAIARAK